jgi:hypothetical protein
MKHVQLWRNVWQRWDEQAAYSSHLQKIQLRELYLAVQALKANPKKGMCSFCQVIIFVSDFILDLFLLLLIDCVLLNIPDYFILLFRVAAHVFCVDR